MRFDLAPTRKLGGGAAVGNGQGADSATSSRLLAGFGYISYLAWEKTNSKRAATMTEFFGVDHTLGSALAVPTALGFNLGRFYTLT